MVTLMAVNLTIVHGFAGVSRTIDDALRLIRMQDEIQFKRIGVVEPRSGKDQRMESKIMQRSRIG